MKSAIKFVKEKCVRGQRAPLRVPSRISLQTTPKAVLRARGVWGSCGRTCETVPLLRAKQPGPRVSGMAMVGELETQLEA